MLPKLKTIVFGLCVCASLACHAQQRKDSVRVLREVMVEQSRLGNYAISQYILPVDSLTRSLASGGSLADMLRKFGYGHLRSYGPGGLATASLRGTGSSHTAVLWNGINLLSPLLGQLDLSLVPVGFIDDVSIQSGGSASLYGNGSIGGTILLNSKATFNKGLNLKTFSTGGSFGSYYQDAAISWSGKKFITSTRVFFSDAANDFKFLNTNIYPAKIERRNHTAYHQKGVLHQNYWQVSPQHLVTLKFWYQDNLYQVPNTTFISRKAEATEHNKFYRTILGWNYSHNNLELNYQGAMIRHDLTYQDPAINLISPSTFTTFINTIEGSIPLHKRASTTSGVNYTWEQGKVADYGANVPVRNRIALFSAVKWKPSARWELAGSVREEVVNGNATPIAPGLTAKVSASRVLSFYGNLSRNYRIPTINDLYWKGAGGLGNPNLKPETSVGGEVGLAITPESKSALDPIFSFKTALFSNHVDNWILWSPVASQTWSPQNIEKVWSRGIEGQASVHKQVSKISLDFFVQYSFTRATNQSFYTSGHANEMGKQLMLTPYHQGSATVRASWKNFYLNVVNSYTGRQFTDSDNSDFFAMAAYDITNVSLSKPFLLQKLRVTLNGEANNIFNTNYQSRPGYPMPGTNFKLGLTINFIKPNSL
jgi:vitamin B12 transporter